MTDWYITFPWATGLVRTENGRVTETAPIFKHLRGMHWHTARYWIERRGGHGWPLK